MKTALCYDDVLIVPRGSEVATRSDVDLSSDRLKIPVFAANMPSVTGVEMVNRMTELGAGAVLHRMRPFYDTLDEVESLKPHALERSFVSVGIGSFAEDEIYCLLDRGVTSICIDVAHAHHSRVLWLVRQVSPHVPRLMVGNIATHTALNDIYQATSDNCQLFVKVGVGSGAACTTRVATGCGMPTLQSLLDMQDLVAEVDVHIVADGGMKTPGDIAKALAAGADSVMLGSMLAGATESPGELLPNGHKVFYGNASQRGKEGAKLPQRNIEGVVHRVPATGPVEHTLKRIKEGLSSAFSYVGARTLREFHRNATFVRVSPAGHRESHPHVVTP